MTQWHFYDKVYRRWVVLMVGPHEEFKQELKDSKFKEMDLIVDSSGMCVELDDSNNDMEQRCTIVWLKAWHLPTLVHELTHLVMMCFGQTDVPISRENTEAFAFYTEFWFIEMQKVRRKYPDGRTPAQAKL